jgi:hypothetical protein
VRLATVTVGGALRVYRERTLSAMGDLAWAPGERILYQVAGNRNFVALDPEGVAATPLVAGMERGWVFAAAPGPDGRRVAVYWNRRSRAGVWLLSLADTSRRLLQTGRVDPIGWSADGRSILTVGWDSADVSRVGLDGRTERLGTLPFRDASCAPAATQGPTALVCAAEERLSDVWLVEGFDPERRVFP